MSLVSWTRDSYTATTPPTILQNNAKSRRHQIIPSSPSNNNCNSNAAGRKSISRKFSTHIGLRNDMDIAEEEDGGGGSGAGALIKDMSLSDPDKHYHNHQHPIEQWPDSYYHNHNGFFHANDDHDDDRSQVGGEEKQHDYHLDRITRGNGVSDPDPPAVKNECHHKEKPTNPHKLIGEECNENRNRKSNEKKTILDQLASLLFGRSDRHVGLGSNEGDNYRRKQRTGKKGASASANSNCSNNNQIISLSLVITTSTSNPASEENSTDSISVCDHNNDKVNYNHRPRRIRSANVFTLFNLLLVLLSLCLIQCQRANCGEVKGSELEEGEHILDKRMSSAYEEDNEDKDKLGSGSGIGNQIHNQSNFLDGYGGSSANNSVILLTDSNKSGEGSIGEGSNKDPSQSPAMDIDLVGGGGESSSNSSSAGKDDHDHNPDQNQSDEPSPFEKKMKEPAAAGLKEHLSKNTTRRTSGPAANKRGSRSVCRLSEFVCKGGRCISADKFCDGVDDCGDGAPASDEPKYSCNRTYYGELGSTYHISLSSETIASALGLNHPLQLDPTSSSPQGGSGHGGPVIFVCHLTFFAAGDNFGDLVQLMFDSVNIGQFVSSVMDGCPEGSLQVAEISRPITGGQWCGSGAGFSVYFSEMSTMTLTLIVGGPSLHSSKQQMSSSQNTSLSHVIRPIDAFPGGSRAGSMQSSSSLQQAPPPPPPEFDFKMRYKFIPRHLAAVRYGLMGSPVERGQLEPGTYCNRILEQCHRRQCKIQSPNYYGLYPRNVSCFFTVRQRDKPQCKRVLIQVSQSRSHKVQLRSLLPGPQLAGMVMGANDPTTSMAVDTFMAWDECNWSRDRIVIYDGNNADSPVILSICGGSHIPPVTSSGPEIHIAFHSTPFGNPLGPVPPPPFPAPLRGFELDVDVVLVDSETADYSNDSPNCTFYFVSSKTSGKGQRSFKLQQEGGNWIPGVTGMVSSPRHTLPPNTTCRYEFKGNENEAIWIYFVSYRRDSVKDAKRLLEGNCTTRLTIRDSLMGHRALIGSFCDGELPKLCEHKALQNETRLVRACTANESYISAGSSLIVEQQFLEGTALRPLHYKFHYEFVNRHPAGMEGSCNRHFHMGKMKSKKGIIRTTDNIFDFGRGGKRNLTCTYTFTMGAHDGVKLSVLKSSFGDRPCRTQTDLETGRYVCNYFVPPANPSSSKGGSQGQGQNDTMSALGNVTYATPHPFFAADHPGGNNTGGNPSHQHHYQHHHLQTSTSSPRAS